MSLAVVGDGIPALACAAYASAMSGESVELLMRGDGDLADVRWADVVGSGRTAVDLTPTQSPAQLEADRFLVVDEVQNLVDNLIRLRDQLDGRSILLAPGGFAGVLRTEAFLAEQGVEPAIVGEASGFPVLGRWEASTTIQLPAIKRQLPVAGSNSGGSRALIAEFGRYIPELVESNLVTTSLCNPNIITHPPIVLVNAVMIDRGNPFGFCRDGISPGAVRLLEAVDRERVAVVRHLGGESLDMASWILRFYGDQGMVGPGIGDCLTSFQPLLETPAPTQLATRYLTDDVPHGIAACLALAQALNLPHANLGAVVVACSTILGKPLQADRGTIELFLRYADKNAQRQQDDLTST